MSNIKVPDGMLMASKKTLSKEIRDHGVMYFPLQQVLETALRWWTENGPPSMKRYDYSPFCGEQGMEESMDGNYLLYTDVKGMFLTTKRETPERLKDLMEPWMDDDTSSHCTCNSHNIAILDAYRRGQKEGSK